MYSYLVSYGERNHNPGEGVERALLNQQYVQ